MLFPPHGLIGRYLHRRSVARWRAATRDVGTARVGDLDLQVQMAKRTMRRIRDFTTEAAGRLALPRPGASTFPRPAGTDWSWRPKPWRDACPELGLAPAMPKDEITNELVIFHDCKTREIALRQIRNTRDIDLSPYSIALEIFHFDGSYLSLVIEIPPSSCEGLKKKHLIRLSTLIERMWVDLMIEDPAMNKITFRDLNLTRYPRAEI